MLHLPSSENWRAEMMNARKILQAISIAGLSIGAALLIAVAFAHDVVAGIAALFLVGWLAGVAGWMP